MTLLQMMWLGECLGYEGDEADWIDEYGELCHHLGSSPAYGLNESAFKGALTHEESSCLCTLEQVKEIQLAMPPFPEVLALSRPELILLMFKELDVAKEGLLRPDSMRTFMTHCGVSAATRGNNADWEEFFRSVCSMYEWGKPDTVHGINIVRFGIVCTDSQGPGYRTSAELREILWKTMISVDVPQLRAERRLLAQRLFHTCEPAMDATGARLDENGMLRFATLLDFSGDESEWIGEYETICTEHCWDLSGPTVALFVEAVDNLDSQLFCSETDVRNLLAGLVLRGEYAEGVLTAPTAGASDAKTEGLVRSCRLAGLSSSIPHDACGAYDAYGGYGYGQEETAADDPGSVANRVLRLRRVEAADDAATQARPKTKQLITLQSDASHLSKVQKTQAKTLHEFNKHTGFETQKERPRSRKTQMLNDALPRDLHNMLARLKGMQEVEEEYDESPLPGSSRDAAPSCAQRMPKHYLNAEIERRAKAKALAGKGRGMGGLTPAKSIGGSPSASGRSTPRLGSPGRIRASERRALRVFRGKRSHSPSTGPTSPGSTASFNSTGTTSPGAKGLGTRKSSLSTLGEGAEDDNEDTDPEEEEITPEEITPTFVQGRRTIIFELIKKGKALEAVEAIRLAPRPTLNRTDIRECNALHVAAELDCAPACVALLNRSSFENPSALCCQGWTALHRGARAGSMEAVQTLLLHKRFPDEAVNSACKRDGFTAMHLAALHGRCEMVKALFHCNRITHHDHADNHGRMVLHLAAHNQDAVMYELFSDLAGKKGIDLTGYDKWSRQAKHVLKKR